MTTTPKKPRVSSARKTATAAKPIKEATTKLGVGPGNTFPTNPLHENPGAQALASAQGFLAFRHPSQCFPTPRFQPGGRRHTHNPYDRFAQPTDYPGMVEGVAIPSVLEVATRLAKLESVHSLLGSLSEYVLAEKRKLYPVSLLDGLSENAIAHEKALEIEAKVLEIFTLIESQKLTPAPEGK